MKPDYKQRIQSIFDTVAEGYDHPVARYFPDAAERMLHHLRLEPSMRLLDVCTGTGMVSLRAAAALPDGHVTAIDLSDRMLQRASEKARQGNLDNIHFHGMDMEYLEFDDHHFDVATCGFGLFFIEDMHQGLKHIADKVRPGGKVAISTFAEDAFEPMTSVFLRRLESFGIETRAASYKQIANEPAMQGLFAAAGMTDVEIYQELLSYSVTAQDWWNIVWNAGYRGYLQQLSEEQLKTFRALHMEEIERLCIEGDGRLDVGVMITVGVKPA